MNKFHHHEECGLPWFAIVLLIVLAVIYATVVATATLPPEGPGLVGVDCTGASGPRVPGSPARTLFAFEESDLPECVSITRR